jgi:chemotaxis protein methyltransferase CheR
MSFVQANVDSISMPPGVAVLLRDLLHEHTGIFFEPGRFDTMLDKLRGRVAAREFSSFLDYYYLLKYEAAAADEWLHVMDAFSVQETYFWREVAQIRALVDVVVPAWFRAHPGKPLRIWSAACATGEEPYSLAMALIEGGYGKHPISIVASDASRNAIEHAREAVYRERSFRALPPELREKYFVPAERGESRLLVERLLPVTFRRANVVSAADTADLATAPVIFCRNVFIYFSPESTRRTAQQFARAMPEGGHLFIGASETLLKLTPAFDLEEICDAFVYVRNRHPV